jgi:hypothetical protein
VGESDGRKGGRLWVIHKTKPLFYYAKQNRRKKADNARKAAGKGSTFGDGATLFLFACFVALIGAVIEIHNYVMFHVSAFFDMVLSYIAFL